MNQMTTAGPNPQMYSRKQQEGNGDGLNQRIVEALESRGPSAEWASMKRENDALRKTLAKVEGQVERLTKQPVLTTEMKRMFARFEQGLETMAKMIPGETDLSGLMGQLTEMKTYVTGMTEAIGNVKLPEMPAPAKFPDIPETNLEPVTELLHSIQEQLATREPSNVVELSTAEEWTFDVKRNPSGYIKTVKAIRG